MYVYRYVNAAERTVYAYIPDGSDEKGFFRKLDGSASIGESWVPLRVAVERTFKSGKPRMDTDFLPFLPDLPVLKARAVDTLGDLLRQYGELLPLACDDEELFLYNVTTVIDALDVERSEFERFKHFILGVTKYSFHAERLIGAGIFKLPPESHGNRQVFFTEPILSAICSAGLERFRYELVWDEDVESR